MCFGGNKSVYTKTNRDRLPDASFHLRPPQPFLSNFQSTFLSPLPLNHFRRPSPLYRDCLSYPGAAMGTEKQIAAKRRKCPGKHPRRGKISHKQTQSDSVISKR
jgi:hypothetical protein